MRSERHVKRIIEGKAYNTATADHIASARDGYNDDRGRDHTLQHELYRTKGGAFFMVLIDRLDDDDDGRDPEVEFYPIRYDTAYTFASGRNFRLGRGEFSGLQVELHMDDIFPTVAEAEEEDGA
jgi:hypothetical protein